MHDAWNVECQLADELSGEFWEEEVYILEWEFE